MNFAYNHMKGGGLAIIEHPKDEEPQKRHPKPHWKYEERPRGNGKRVPPNGHSDDRESTQCIARPRPSEEERKKEADAMRAEVAAILAEETTTLHEACEGKKGFVTIYLGYPNRVTGRNTWGYFSLDCEKGWARIVKATRPIKWVENYGWDDELPYFVKLNPPDFRKPEDRNGQFPDKVQTALANQWKKEEVEAKKEKELVKAS